MPDYVTHTIYVDQNAADASDEVGLPTNQAVDVTVQVTGGFTTDTLTPQVTLDGTNWVTCEGFEVDDSATAVTSIGANGVFRFDVTGAAAFRLDKTGTADTISALAKTTFRS